MCVCVCVCARAHPSHGRECAVEDGIEGGGGELLVPPSFPPSPAHLNPAFPTPPSGRMRGTGGSSPV